MKRLLFAASCLACALLAAQDKYRIPAFKDLPKPELMPRTSVLSVDENGDILRNGKPHFHLGMQIGSDLISDLIKVKGTPEELSWIYDEPLDYESAQRLGFDALSLFHINSHLPQFDKTYWNVKYKPENAKLYSRTLGCQLPFYVDFTEFPWGNGILARRKVLPADAINQYNDTEGNHWVAYNVNHPKTKEIFKAMLEDGIRRTLTGNPPVIAYELFNEPAYNDPSPYNRKLFAEYLKKQYGTVDKLNQNYGTKYASFEAVTKFRHKTDNPGLFVDWSKFLEKSFTDHVAFGKEVVMKADPKGRTTVQIMGYDYYRFLPKSNINMYEISKIMNAVTVPTGGGIGGCCQDAPAAHALDTPLSLKGEGMLMRHVYRNFSEGKIQVNSELYYGNSYKNGLNHVWMDFLRGSNVSYLFSWSKRGWEWREKGVKRLAEMYPYCMLNPVANKPEDIHHYRLIKNEIMRFDEFFASRKRNVKREVAVLLSYPTERYAGAVGNTAKNDITIYTSALEFTHYPIDAILEEQLPEGRGNRYKAIVACGTQNIYPATAMALYEYVSKGGILILGRAAMQQDEYGHKIDWKGVFDGLKLKQNPVAQQGELVFSSSLKQPALLPGKIKARGVLEITGTSGWEKLAFLGNNAAVAGRKLGKGYIYFIAPEMQDYPAAAVLEAILEKHGVKPLLDLQMKKSRELAVNVETHVSRRGKRTAVFCMNYDNFPKIVCLNMADLKGKRAYDLLHKKELPLSKDGAVVMLPAGSRAIVGIGPEGSFGNYPAVTEKDLEKMYAENGKLAKAERKVEKEFSYSPDLARTTPVDMRKFYNRHFIDSVSGDGKGGWTDQGADNSLDGVPWGINKFAGVPCEIVRFDQNDNKTCLVMASKSRAGHQPVEVKGIPVNRKAKALYFFHCAAWCNDGNKGMTYRINYADGTHVDHPTIVGKNLFDWWVRSTTKQIAWKNSANKGFQVDRWLNPNPGKEVRSIDIISPNTKIVPIVIAVTVEEIDPDSPVMNAYPWTLNRTGGFGGVREKYDKASGEVSFSVNEKTGDWAGVNIGNNSFGKRVSDFAKWDRGFLVFEIKGGPDRYGNPRKGPSLQLAMMHRKANGKPSGGTSYISIAPYVEGKVIPADSFVQVRVPLSRQKWSKGNMNPINTVALQYRGTGKSSGGFSLRNLRFEIPE